MKSRIADSCVCCDSKDFKKSPAILMPFVAQRAFDWKPVEINKSWGLKTIKNGMAYSICNSVLCSNCFHLFLDIRFSDDEMGRLYDHYRETAYINLREKYEPGYKTRNKKLNLGYQYLNEIENFLRPFLRKSSAILDWGGDSGKNTPFQSACDFLHIYDISQRPVVGKAVRIEKNQTQNTKYDLIVCSHVLEHAPYPGDILSDIRSAMNKNTVLYIEFPYENLVRTTKNKNNLHRLKRHWHEHVNFFNERSAEELLSNSDLEILKLKKLLTSGESSEYVFQIVCKLKNS